MHTEKYRLGLGWRLAGFLWRWLERPAWAMRLLSDDEVSVQYTRKIRRTKPLVRRWRRSVPGMMGRVAGVYFKDPGVVFPLGNALMLGVMGVTGLPIVLASTAVGFTLLVRSFQQRKNLKKIFHQSNMRRLTMRISEKMKLRARPARFSEMVTRSLFDNRAARRLTGYADKFVRTRYAALSVGASILAASGAIALARVPVDAAVATYFAPVGAMGFGLANLSQIARQVQWAKVKARQTRTSTKVLITGAEILAKLFDFLSPAFHAVGLASMGMMAANGLGQGTAQMVVSGVFFAGAATGLGLAVKRRNALAMGTFAEVMGASALVSLVTGNVGLFCSQILVLRGYERLSHDAGKMDRHPKPTRDLSQITATDEPFGRDDKVRLSPELVLGEYEESAPQIVGVVETPTTKVPRREEIAQKAAEITRQR